MADPKDLQEASEAIHQVRGLAAVQRHKELDEPVPVEVAMAWSGPAANISRIGLRVSCENDMNVTGDDCSRRLSCSFQRSNAPGAITRLLL
jgi:hypothetical protein